MFQIKICGVTNLGDAQVAIDAGADALGFNFYRSSKRFVEQEDAAQITDQLPHSVLKVGVFVNHGAREIQAAVERLSLDCVQLHGEERAEFLAGLPVTVPVLRAFRCGPTGLAPLASYLAECRSFGRLPDAVLFDADVAGTFGGTGRAADWSLIAKQRSLIGDLPLILAGGLTPQNVGTGIAAVHPDAVDVASGVEQQPGKKDANLMKRFVAAARDAFDRI